MRDHGQIHFQQVLAVLAQLLNEVQRVENRQKHVTLSEHIRQVELADLIPIVGNGHAVFPAGTGQFVVRTCFIHETHPDGDIRIVLIMKPVNPALPEEGEPGYDEGNGICDAGFASAVAAGDDGWIAEDQLRGALVGLKARNVHAGDLKLFDLFQMTTPFFF